MNRKDKLPIPLLINEITNASPDRNFTTVAVSFVGNLPPAVKMFFPSFAWSRLTTYPLTYWANHSNSRTVWSTEVADGHYHLLGQRLSACFIYRRWPTTSQWMDFLSSGNSEPEVIFFSPASFLSLPNKEQEFWREKRLSFFFMVTYILARLSSVALHWFFTSTAFRTNVFFFSKSKLEIKSWCVIFFFQNDFSRPKFSCVYLLRGKFNMSL